VFPAAPRYIEWGGWGLTGTRAKWIALCTMGCNGPPPRIQSNANMFIHRWTGSTLRAYSDSEHGVARVPLADLKSRECWNGAYTLECHAYGGVNMAVVLGGSLANIHEWFDGVVLKIEARREEPEDHTVIVVYQGSDWARDNEGQKIWPLTPLDLQNARHIAGVLAKFGWSFVHGVD
jgi:hypothetical protein